LRARSSESKVPWVLMRFAFYGHCGDRIVEERGGNLLEALGELQFYFLDKPAEWIYGATYRLWLGGWRGLAGSTGSSRGSQVRPHLPPVQREGEDMQPHCQGHTLPRADEAKRISMK